MRGDGAPFVDIPAVAQVSVGGVGKYAVAVTSASWLPAHEPLDPARKSVPFANELTGFVRNPKVSGLLVFFVAVKLVKLPLPFCWPPPTLVNLCMVAMVRPEICTLGTANTEPASKSPPASAL